jgi:hypothetical protein
VNDQPCTYCLFEFDLCCLRCFRCPTFAIGEHTSIPYHVADHLYHSLSFAA